MNPEQILIELVTKLDLIKLEVKPTPRESKGITRNSNKRYGKNKGDICIMKELLVINSIKNQIKCIRRGESKHL